MQAPILPPEQWGNRGTTPKKWANQERNEGESVLGKTEAGESDDMSVKAEPSEDEIPFYVGEISDSVDFRQKQEKPAELFKCAHCPKVFKTNTGLFGHTDKAQLKCEDCGKQFGCKSQLNVHYRDEHTDEKPFKCDFCGEDKGRNARKHF